MRTKKANHVYPHTVTSTVANLKKYLETLSDNDIITMGMMNVCEESDPNNDPYSTLPKFPNPTSPTL